MISRTVKLLGVFSLAFISLSSINNALADNGLCNISFIETSGMVEVLATTKKSVSDDLKYYSLNVESASNGGKSNSVQSGKINFPLGLDEIVLSRSIINVSRNGSLNAVLSIKDSNGLEICKTHKSYGSFKNQEIKKPDTGTKI